MKDCVLVLVLLGVFTACGGPQPDPTSMQAGYAAVDITPPDGTPLGGYGLPGGIRVTEGVHDQLYAQVTVFKNDIGDAMIIIAMDSAGYFYEFAGAGPGVADVRRSIAEALKRDLKIEPQHILITTSHSHAATDLVGFWQKAGEPIDLQMLNQLEADLVQTCQDAVVDLQPVDLYFGQGELAGYSGRDSDCSDVIDNTVGILQPRTTDGEPLVTLVNYANHPTMMGEDNRLASSDFIWGFREEMQAQTGAPGVFLQGSIAAVHSGDLPVPGDGWDRTYNMGKLLADEVVETLPELVLGEVFDIHHRWKVVSCPIVGELVILAHEVYDIPKRRYHTEGGSYVLDYLEMSWHALGPAEFACVPGEPTPEYGFMFRDRMVRPQTFVIAQANDAMGYFVDPESIAKDTTGQLDGYELQMGLGPPGGPCMWDAHVEMDWFDGAALD
jgi:hypothetical protein